MAGKKLVVAKENFWTPEGMIAKGDIFEASDPAVKGRDLVFAPVETDVEQATAAPGEKRTRTRPKAEDAEA